MAICVLIPQDRRGNHAPAHQQVVQQSVAVIGKQIQPDLSHGDAAANRRRIKAKGEETPHFHTVKQPCHQEGKQIANRADKQCENESVF